MYYNNTYYVKVESKADKTDNPMINYSNVNGHVAVPLYFNEGERGYFVAEMKDNDVWDRWHRVYTSEVQNISVLDNELIIETQNTMYHFKKRD